MDRLAPCRRPAARPQGFQRWDRLLFSHFEVPEALLRPLVHPRLSIDSFEGRCFVGVVMFEMQRVRPYRFLPSFPTATRFAQINLRTYVHVDGEEPGVFFLSLDCESTLVVQVARALWHVPYHRAHFTREEREDRVHWSAERQSSPCRFEADFVIGAELPAAQLGSLEFFLTERYQFYAGKGDDLLRARVHHVPYPLHEARVTTFTPSLVEATGLPTDGARTPDYWSPGVDVDIHRLERVR